MSDLELKPMEELKYGQSKRKELEMELARLIEDLRAFSDRQIETTDQVEKMLKENSMTLNEQDKLIIKLNWNLVEEKLKNQRLLKEHQDKVRCMAEEIAKLNQDILDLKIQKSLVKKNLVKTRLEADRAAEKLKQITEATQMENVLRLMIFEFDKATDVSKTMHQDMEPMVMKIKETLAKHFKFNVSNIASLADDLDEHAVAEIGQNMDYMGSKDGQDSLGDSSIRDGMCAVKIASSKELPASCTTENGTGLVSSKGHSGKGGNVVVQISGPKIDTATTIKASRGSECNSSHEISKTIKYNRRKKPPASGTNPASVTDVVQVSDTNKEMEPVEVIIISNTIRNAGEGDEIVMHVSPIALLPSARIRQKDQPPNGKRKLSDISVKSTPEFATNIVGAPCSSEIDIPKFHCSNHLSPTDSDTKSCSDSDVEKLIASLRSKTHKWKSVNDMEQAFQEDPKLCMDAICLLYRLETLRQKSSGVSNITKEFNPIHSKRVRELVECLVAGDPEFKIRKPLAEVKRLCPDALNSCMMLANIYKENLYEIYVDKPEPHEPPGPESNRRSSRTPRLNPKYSGETAVTFGIRQGGFPSLHGEQPLGMANGLIFYHTTETRMK